MRAIFGPATLGAQLIANLRAHFPNLPILLATGYDELPSCKLSDIPKIGKTYTQPQLASEVARLLR